MSNTITIPKSNHVLSPVMFYVNRDDEINKIVSILNGDAYPAAKKKCIVRGKPGAGKTELYRKVAYQLSLDFSDAQIYLKLQENDSSLPMPSNKKARMHIVMDKPLAWG